MRSIYIYIYIYIYIFIISSLRVNFSGSLTNRGPNKPVTRAADVTLSFTLLPSSKCLMNHGLSEVASSSFFRQGTLRQSYSLSLGSIL